MRNKSKAAGKGSIHRMSFLEFQMKAEGLFEVLNKKSKDSLGIIEKDRDRKKFIFAPEPGTKFEEEYSDEITAFLKKLNIRDDLQEKSMSVTATSGRPSTQYYKHGFYINKFRPCLSCPKQKDGSCPYFYTIKGLEHLHEHSFDTFGVNRCVPEIKYFESLKKIFKEQFKLTPSDEPILDKMCMSLVRSGRVEEYIADQGLTQMRAMKDEKTGEIHKFEVQNILKRDVYFEDKMFREWLDNLKISRKSRDEADNPSDLAIEFTKEVKVTKTIKMTKRKDSEIVENEESE